VKYVLYLYISTFRSMCAVPNTAVCCSSLISCFPDMLLRYCLSDFEETPVAPIILISLLLSHSTRAEFLYFYKIFSASFFITFLSPGIATSIIIIITIIIIVITIFYYYFVRS
jgi:hypothetical protein